MKNDKVKRLLPYLLSLLIIVLDQATKSWFVHNIPEGTIGYSFFGDFLWIVHVRNTAVAFSMGDGLPLIIKYICIAIMGSIFIITLNFFKNIIYIINTFYIK